MKTVLLFSLIFCCSNFSHAQTAATLAAEQAEECSPSDARELADFQKNFPEHLLPTSAQLGAALLGLNPAAVASAQKNVNPAATKAVNNNGYSAPLYEDKDLGVIRPHNFFTYSINPNCVKK